jgi:hypothetical protein
VARALLILANPSVRARAKHWVDIAPEGTRVTFQQPRRSVDQNSKLWAALTDISVQLPWHGVKLTPDDYKLLFMDALKREMRICPNIDGTGFVNLGRSSSDLSKSEFSDLIEIIYAFGAQHGVVFHERELESA